MRTRITDMLGIDIPILAFSHCRDVVAAVTRAGGLGVLGAAGHSDAQLDIDLEWIEDQVGDLPYGVDLIAPAKYTGSDQGGMAVNDLVAMIPEGHRTFLHELLDRYDVPDLPDDERPRRGLSAEASAPLTAERAAPQLDITLAHRASLIVNALGSPILKVLTLSQPLPSATVTVYKPATNPVAVCVVCVAAFPLQL